MTDSQSGPNGPSLKFAALSVESYHLDSPPFTGTAVGGAANTDKLDEAGAALADHHRTSSNGTSGRPRIDGDYAGETTTSPRRPNATRSQSRQPNNSSQGSTDRDVPTWDLDAKRSIPEAPTSASTADSAVSSIQYRGGRPLHTQLTNDLNSSEMESQHEPDQEVDGDGQGFVISSSRNSQDEIVPIQSQRKVRRIQNWYRT